MNAADVLESPHLNTSLKSIVDDLIDSCLIDDAFSMHRAIKLDYFHLIAPVANAEDQHSDVPLRARSGANTGRDSSSKSSGCCRCVKCYAKVAATRFAPHLSNCMGLGRNSSRRANKRIAEQRRLEDYDEYLDNVNRIPVVPAPPKHSNSTPNLEATTTTRYLNGTINKHSPLKLTISLVPIATNSDSGSKSFNRHLSSGSLRDPAQLSLTDANVRSSSSKLPDELVVAANMPKSSIQLTSFTQESSIEQAKL